VNHLKDGIESLLVDAHLSRVSKAGHEDA